MEMPTHIVAVGGIVEDGHGNILLVKTHHQGWVYPGGQVEVGENLVEALCREIKEESGIDVQVSHMIGVYSNSGMYKWYDGVTDVPTKVMMDFVCKPVGGELCTSDETTESSWIPQEKVLDMIIAPAVRKRFETFLNFEGKVTYMEYVTHPMFDLKYNSII